MKRIVALVLVLTMAFAMLSACAEENAGTLNFSGLSVSHAVNGKTRSVKLGKISLFVAVGSSGSLPTLQATLDNGKGQVVDAVVQIVGTEVWASMGGISGIYGIDLTDYADNEAGATLLAQLIGGTLNLAGMHLDAVLRTLTTEDSKGIRTMEVGIPSQLLSQVTRGLLTLADGMDATESLDMQALYERVDAMQEGAVLGFKYDESRKTFTLYASQGDENVQLSGKLELDNVPMTFVDVSLEEEKFYVKDMDARTLEQLRGEMNLIAIKFAHFADGSGLDDIM